MNDNDNWLVASIMQHGDASEATYRTLADQFRLAHSGRALGGLSIEVGTRRGGSALLQLVLLDTVYSGWPNKPMLITVDPYGGKDYRGGGGKVAYNLYGDDEYIAAKKLLSNFGNHVHFPITSLDFLTFVERGLRLWRGGQEVWVTKDSTSFVFLDGDHDQGTIMAEVACFTPMLLPGGRILIDNTDEEPVLMEALQTFAEQNHLSLHPVLKDAAVLVKRSNP